MKIELNLVGYQVAWPATWANGKGQNTGHWAQYDEEDGAVYRPVVAWGQVESREGKSVVALVLGGDLGDELVPASMLPKFVTILGPSDWAAVVEE